MTDLMSALEGVRDAESFATFVRALRAEIAANRRADPDAVNLDLDPFLSALADWSRGFEGRAAIDGSNPWKATAKALVMGHYHV